MPILVSYNHKEIKIHCIYATIETFIECKDGTIKNTFIQANFHSREGRDYVGYVVRLLSRCRFNDGLLPLLSFLITRSFDRRY